MSREILQQARQLIIEERYADARSLLITIKEHPTAREWLAKIDSALGDANNDVSSTNIPRRRSTVTRQSDLRGIRLIYLLSTVIVGLLIIIILGVLPVSVSVQEIDTIQWEYLRVEQTSDGFVLNDTELVDAEVNTLMEYLDELGDAGWELVSVVPNGSAERYILKRPQ